jgi:allantoinase
MIASARRAGIRLTVETCPHYLALSAEDVPDGGTAFKCSPPIREAENREALWDGLQSGLIDQVVSDHSPSTAEMKRIDTGDFGTAWGGISSLQLSLSVVWTEASRRGFGLPDVVGWMCERPARLARLAPKGRIRNGADADLVVFAPDEEFDVDPSRLEHRNPLTPYIGRRLRGRVRRTWLRGTRWDGVGRLGREVPG